MIIPEIPEVLARMGKAKSKIISEIGTAMTTDLPACPDCSGIEYHRRSCPSLRLMPSAPAPVSHESAKTIDNAACVSAVIGNEAGIDYPNALAHRQRVIDAMTDDLVTANSRIVELTAEIARLRKYITGYRLAEARLIRSERRRARDKQYTLINALVKALQPFCQAVATVKSGKDDFHMTLDEAYELAQQAIADAAKFREGGG